MEITETEIPDVKLIQPTLFGDQRGFFLEVYHQEKFHAHGISLNFVQDNLSRSQRGVLRGLHYQVQHPQGKLVTVLAGEIYDVAVDRSDFVGRESTCIVHSTWVRSRISCVVRVGGCLLQMYRPVSSRA